LYERIHQDLIIRGVKVKQNKKSRKDYNPNLGFIGNSEVKVSNYLFSAKRLRSAYDHAKPLADRILNKEVSTHYHESKKLTKFLKNRDLTFSKKTSKGYKTFTVPCTTTIVPLEKSLFNEVEQAAQRLMISLRHVLQDIYGSESLDASKFVQSLPESVRKIFIESVKSSSSYYSQLHHKNMKDYPFLDNVGLDLVLVEDYIQKSETFPQLIAKNKENELPGLPFRILEINAGSPSGASNNMNMLEGIYDQNPEILNSLGKVMPNDHFKILGETYKSLGDDWTGITDGVQILLPPGGQNGAAPEIHQLAAFSGLIYTDPDQLYQDNKGYIRLRTVGEKNPIVTAIYSRVNADSALFDPKKGLIMRNPDTGENIYLRDALKLDKKGKAPIVTDANGKKVPLESAYAIPGAIDAVLNRKLYMGGLNRIMDNKIILATLTHYAPKFFAKKIKKAGLDPNGKRILPPQTLPPTIESARIITKNPDEWVVKAPDSAGGQGIYILKTLDKKTREEVLEAINKRPQDYAYQQLVKIARIPVAVERKDGYRFANLAADIRMWVFFGGGKNAVPKISHNALVRYAPQERGKMSSIVNTSAGGGYAPFVIVDDTNDKNSVTAKELASPKVPVKLSTQLPIFVAAQMVQIGRMLREANQMLNSEITSANELLGVMLGMKIQLKEVLSFLHPRAIENTYKIIDLLEAKINKVEIAAYYKTVNSNQLEIVRLMQSNEARLANTDFRDTLDSIRVLNVDVVNTTYSAEDRALDLVMVSELKVIAKDAKSSNVKANKEISRLIKLIKMSAFLEIPTTEVSSRSKTIIKDLLLTLCAQAQERLNDSPLVSEFAEIFELDNDLTELKYETLYLGKKDDDKEIKVATQMEMRTGKLLTESSEVSEELKEARSAWLKITQNARLLKREDKKSYLSIKRTEHFANFPILRRYQDLLSSTYVTKDILIELLPITPYAKFNIEKFAAEKGITLEEVFSDTLKKDRISVLSSDKLKKLKLSSRDHAGECFAKKKTSHGLYSESDIFIWLRQELDPFTMLYTAGHELIHYQQIKHSMAAEARAIKDGGLSSAKFLNYYGNFLGANRRTVDAINFNMLAERKPLYGYTDRLLNDFSSPIITELRNSLSSSDLSWEKKLNKYGSLFGYMMPNAAGTRVKALQEVLPTLENAKNITFAQELGLEINLDAVMSAMPAANKTQIKTYTPTILKAVKQANVDWEALRVIANHQFHGITFYRADKDSDNLSLKPTVTAVNVGNSYNQTQQ
jgi:uncharacterized circularly permuted ATP-grasp superfamily protein